MLETCLHIRAGLIPISESPVHLAAQIKSGITIVDEASVDVLGEIHRNLLLMLSVNATPEAIDAVKEAELIVLGPGSFLTSITPSLLIDEISNTIKHSKAKIIFIDNI